MTDLPCRYVCAECLRTFLGQEAHDDLICWKCGSLLICVTKGKVYEKPKMKSGAINRNAVQLVQL